MAGPQETLKCRICQEPIGQAGYRRTTHDTEGSPSRTKEHKYIHVLCPINAVNEKKH